uniref:Eukaryotic translation initiation factor 3 30 kDa subunit n=1 Tax=Heterorhabditis bacteriophora TaxID=37862 RepID=A0A1I7WB39_HETBA
MGDNWDDEDFEPEVQSLAPPPVVETVPAEPTPAVKPKPKKMVRFNIISNVFQVYLEYNRFVLLFPIFLLQNVINMESLGREPSAAEKEELQRRQDLALAKEMFGGMIFFCIENVKETVRDVEDSSQAYCDILSKEEFEEWGIKVGRFLATRHKASHYGDMLNKLLTTIAEKLESNEVRVMSNHLKALADAKKLTDKPKPASAGGAKAKKATLKVNKGNSKAYDNCAEDDGKMMTWLQMWQLESNVELTTEDSFEAMPVPYNTILFIYLFIR